jgi:hypothetical protein
LIATPCDVAISCGISSAFALLSPSVRQVAHALLTRPPLRYFVVNYSISPLDLHVLGTPPAFVLSQDQTLKLNIYSHYCDFNNRLNLLKRINLLASLYCLVFKDHLISFPKSLFCLPASSADLYYNIKICDLCQHLFYYFLLLCRIFIVCISSGLLIARPESYLIMHLSLCQLLSSLFYPACLWLDRNIILSCLLLSCLLEIYTINHDTLYALPNLYDAFNSNTIIVS